MQRGSSTPPSSSSSRASAATKKKLVVGEAVWVKPTTRTGTTRSAASSGPRKGKVKRLRSSGAIDIYYENGDVEEGVGNDRISYVKPAMAGATPGSKSTASAEAKPLFSPAARDDETKAAARRAKTADGAARDRAAVSRMTPPQSAGATRSTGKYVDMSEVLNENQQKVVELLEAIQSQRDDATSVKNAFSNLLRVLRAAPQVTAECIRQQKAEYQLLETIRAHVSHAVLLCYGCVLIRKLCHLSIEATEIFVQEQLVPLAADALRRFPEDAILQASVCGCLAVLAQSSNPSKNQMLECDLSVVPLVIASLNIHREYSNLSRQVQIYACEVLTELCDYGGRPTAALISDCSSTDPSTIELLTTMLRQGIAQQDKKVTCAFCTLLLCLTANSTEAAEALRSLDAIADLSVVMAKYPVDEGITRFSVAALREIAATSLTHSPSRRVMQTARVILEDDTYAQPPRLNAAAADILGSSRSSSREPSQATKTSRARSKSPRRNPSPTGGAKSFGRFSAQVGKTPTAFSGSDYPSDLHVPAASSKTPAPRSRDDHNRSTAPTKKAKSSTKVSEEREKLLLKTYGAIPAGLSTKATTKQRDRSTGAPPSSSVRDVPDFGRSSSPMHNNFVLGMDMSSRITVPQPLSTQTDKLPRTNSGKLLPLTTEKVKFSTSRASTSGIGGDQPKASSRQTAVVVTKVGSGAERRGRSTDPKKAKKTNVSGTRSSRQSKSPPRIKTSGDPAPARSRQTPIASPRCSALEGTDPETVAELHEFAQQLLREEERIASLLANSKSPSSPGRMTFSDKLHKMIEIAESSMFERTAEDFPTEAPSVASAAAIRDQQSQATPSVALPALSKTSAAEPKPSSETRKSPRAKSGGYKEARAAASQRKPTGARSLGVGELTPASGSSTGTGPVLPDLNARVPFVFDSAQDPVASARPKPGPERPLSARSESATTVDDEAIEQTHLDVSSPTKCVDEEAPEASTQLSTEEQVVEEVGEEEIDHPPKREEFAVDQPTPVDDDVPEEIVPSPTKSPSGITADDEIAKNEEAPAQVVEEIITSQMVEDQTDCESAIANNDSTEIAHESETPFGLTDEMDFGEENATESVPPGQTARSDIVESDTALCEAVSSIVAEVDQGVTSSVMKEDIPALDQDEPQYLDESFEQSESPIKSVATVLRDDKNEVKDDVKTTDESIVMPSLDLSFFQSTFANVATTGIQHALDEVTTIANSPRQCVDISGSTIHEAVEEEPTDADDVSVFASVAASQASHAIVISALQNVIQQLTSPEILAKTIINSAADQVAITESSQSPRDPEQRTPSPRLDQQIDQSNEAEPSISVPMALEIRKVVAAVVALSVEQVLGRIEARSAKESLSSSTQGIEEPTNQVATPRDDADAVHADVNSIIATSLSDTIAKLRSFEQQTEEPEVTEERNDEKPAEDDENESGECSVPMAIAIRRCVD